MTTTRAGHVVCTVHCDGRTSDEFLALATHIEELGYMCFLIDWDIVVYTVACDG